MRPYRDPYNKKNEIKRIMQELLSLGVIQPSQSSYSSPTLLVRKSDETWRLCVDYKGLNNVTIKNKFLILLVEELHGESRLTRRKICFATSKCWNGKLKLGVGMKTADIPLLSSQV